jgi:ubiquitin-conjugating enzyme E2 L3
MAANKRLAKELQDIKADANMRVFTSINVSQTNLFVWEGVILPQEAPYNLGAFKIKIEYPEDYPFKPPKVTFQTRIYHPNVDDKGQVCLSIINPDQWKPATKTDQVVQALAKLICHPEPEHPLRAELAEEFVRNKAQFLQKAEQETRQYAEKRP